ncbi:MULTISPECIES: hypothetical protein [Rathayibacter]|jgi:hypothetical protein|uniref:Uncharacterized protein n=2 Tax=Rathayibacter festucae TaxID=110937 RepID=A0A3T0SWZ4_9MICO|nr:MULTISPECIES: hypothetical protein [Rathayibacter]AZZ50834.1 hypothetical protein C1I64_01360 [Rathayibacter festucae DSM 15932]MCJ1672537.1 hypothetical protein [Rathayibacter sp. VKM Ac-2929]MCJ1682015.1 hypothetical protein [Rathayibacter sp. VKM Ac-2928]MCJ1686040.1 hypothetical protein [Rathayibacter sp. VKM Ac-2927]MCJ1705583.1 hypothetical protein [Rathayibacter sp. VKM Ac-2926]
MPSFRSTLLALAASVALVGAAATPALADHNAGANLDGYASTDISSNGSCYYGALLPAAPGYSLQTKDYRFVRSGTSLTLVCVFTGIPAFVPADDTVTGDDYTAPTRLTRYVSLGSCLPPGVDSASELYPDYEREVPRVDAVTYSYRSTTTMVCHWRVDPTR